jgi:hypothetical protein
VGPRAAGPTVFFSSRAPLMPCAMQAKPHACNCIQQWTDAWCALLPRPSTPGMQTRCRAHACRRPGRRPCVLHACSPSGRPAVVSSLPVRVLCRHAMHRRPGRRLTTLSSLSVCMPRTTQPIDQRAILHIYINNRDILLLIISSKLHIGPWALHATAAAARTGPDQNAVERARAASMATPTTATGAAGFGPCTRADGAASCRPAEPRMGGYTTT